MESRMKLNLILRAGNTSVPWKKAAARLPLSRLRQWRYRYLEGVGQEVIIEFVDTCMCGDYHMTMDRSEKDALLMTPGGGLTQYETNGNGQQGRSIQLVVDWNGLVEVPSIKRSEQTIRSPGTVGQAEQASHRQVQGLGGNCQPQADR